MMYQFGLWNINKIGFEYSEDGMGNNLFYKDILKGITIK